MTSRDEDRLTHLVYDAALDNSLWPEMIIELTEHMETGARTLPKDARHATTTTRIIQHLKQTFRISQRFLDYQEQTQVQQQLFNTMSLGIGLFDESGNVTFENNSNLVDFSLGSVASNIERYGPTHLSPTDG